jgi:hypothetical protein
MVDVFHKRWFEINISNIILIFYFFFRIYDHDFDCGVGDTSDESSCGK